MAPSPNPQQPSKAARSSKNSSGNGLQSLVKAEKLTQMAFILPVSLLVGWLMGAALDKWFHQHWIYMVGIGMGLVSGFVQLIRMASFPATFAATAPDPPAPRGIGFADDLDEQDQDRDERVQGAGKGSDWNN
jgi:ATP synthase protein I